MTAPSHFSWETFTLFVAWIPKLTHRTEMNFDLDASNGANEFVVVSSIANKNVEPTKVGASKLKNKRYHKVKREKKHVFAHVLRSNFLKHQRMVTISPKRCNLREILKNVVDQMSFLFTITRSQNANQFESIYFFEELRRAAALTEDRMLEITEIMECSELRDRSRLFDLDFDASWILCFRSRSL